MGLKELLGMGTSPSERLVRAFERLAAAAERSQGAAFRSGGAEPPKEHREVVLYTDDEAIAVEEARRLAYELATGIHLGPFDDPPGPVDPATGLPWGEPPPPGDDEEEGGGQ
jgi:hypothetical protein